MPVAVRRARHAREPSVVVRVVRARVPHVPRRIRLEPTVPANVLVGADREGQLPRARVGRDVCLPRRVVLRVVVVRGQVALRDRADDEEVRLVCDRRGSASQFDRVDRSGDAVAIPGVLRKGRSAGVDGGTAGAARTARARGTASAGVRSRAVHVDTREVPLVIAPADRRCVAGGALVGARLAVESRAGVDGRGVGAGVDGGTAGAARTARVEGLSRRVEAVGTAEGPERDDESEEHVKRTLDHGSSPFETLDTNQELSLPNRSHEKTSQ